MSGRFDVLLDRQNFGSPLREASRASYAGFMQIRSWKYRVRERGGRRNRKYGVCRCHDLGNGIPQWEDPELSFHNYVDALNAAQRLNEQENQHP